VIDTITVIPEADFLQICDLNRKASCPGSAVRQVPGEKEVIKAGASVIEVCNVGFRLLGSSSLKGRSLIWLMSPRSAKRA
jgi:hypothetical protein